MTTPQPPTPRAKCLRECETPSNPPPLAAPWAFCPPPSPSPRSHLPQDLHRRHFGPPQDYPGGHHCRAATRPAPTQGQWSAGQWAGPHARTKTNFRLHGHKDKDEVGGGCRGWGRLEGYGKLNLQKRGPKERGLAASLNPKEPPAPHPRLPNMPAWNSLESCLCTFTQAAPLYPLPLW